MEGWNCLLLLLFSFYVSRTHCNYAAKEASLLRELRNNYDVDHRPSETTVINSSLAVFALNKLDIGAELMSVTAILMNAWVDPRLAWNASEHNGIQQMVVPTKYLWTPPLVIENEVNKVGILGSDGAPLRIMYNGVVVWTPPMSTTTSCSVDISYYPYDRQTCSIILIGWSYTVAEMDLVADARVPILLKFYTGNGEWDLLGTSHELIDLTEDNRTFRKISFNLTFRRKWQFYGQNVIIPIVLNSMLMVMVFVVPLESGEKMGYCLTVLLSYIVLLTIVNEDLPSISSQLSVIQIYLCVVMCMGTAGAMCTTVVLRLYNKDEREPVPGWLQSLTGVFLAPVTCRSCKSNRVISPSSKDFANQTRNLKQIYSFKEIARMMDTIFFRLFAAVMLMLTLGFLFILNHNY